MSDPISIGAAILRTRRIRPIRQLLSRPASQPLSYRGLGGYLVRCAARLRESGLGREARVAVALPSGARWRRWRLSRPRAPPSAVPIDTQLTAPEIDGRLASLRPRAVVVARRRALSAARRRDGRRRRQVMRQSREDRRQARL